MLNISDLEDPDMDQTVTAVVALVVDSAEGNRVA